MTHSQKVVILLFFITLLGGIVTGASFYYHLAYFWGGLYLFAWVNSCFALHGLELVRKTRVHRSQVGLNLEERFELINHSKIPHLWVVIQNLSPLPGAKGSRVISLIQGKEMRSYLIRTRLIRRGLFPLGDTILSSADIFGLFPVQHRVLAQDSLLVFPMTVDIADFPSPAGTLAGGEAMRRRTQQITPNAAGVREYLPGDPLNRIHWLSSARRNQLIVKEFELDPLADIWIFFDADKRLHRGTPQQEIVLNPRETWKRVIDIPLPPSSLEVQVVACASLVKYFLEKNRAVGFIAQERNLHVLTAERGARQFIKIMESLAIIQAEGNLPIQDLIESQVKLIANGSTVILFSPAQRESLFVATYNLQQRGFHPIIIFLDAASFEDSEGSTPETEVGLGRNVPFYVIRKGSDLTQVLCKSAY
ncbi:MAG: DUF58 domain-containing protein, partial [Anaerolineales bacterium]